MKPNDSGNSSAASFMEIPEEVFDCHCSSGTPVPPHTRDTVSVPRSGLKGDQASSRNDHWPSKVQEVPRVQEIPKPKRTTKPKSSAHICRPESSCNSLNEDLYEWKVNTTLTKCSRYTNGRLHPLPLQRFSFVAKRLPMIPGVKHTQSC